MSEVVIKIENLSKYYRLGTIGRETLSGDLKRLYRSLLGSKSGSQHDHNEDESTEAMWALQNVNLDVKRGEVVGIIGRNGAGKSTLLKILSRITTPSSGSFKVKGRISSLLEVGTGFHPELSGKENIFLNGAIMGMSRKEIRGKLDEIIDFSGVERFIDTPVKRYSSGMYVRLAFAVAAHLEPDILIVDEVLAVGDAEFQKKSMGKMRNVSENGRTVLFVSHNMPTIRALCNSVMVLDKGKSVGYGNTGEMVSEYLKMTSTEVSGMDGIVPDNLSLYHTGEAKLKFITVMDLNGVSQKSLYFKDTFMVMFRFEARKYLEDVSVIVYIVNSFGERVMMSVDNENFKPSSYEKGMHEISVVFDEQLMPGEYSISVSIAYYHTGSAIDVVESFSKFKVIKENRTRDMEYPWGTVHGYTMPKTAWAKKIISK